MHNINLVIFLQNFIIQECGREKLPVDYSSQSKTWMTGEILDNVLKNLNRQLKSNGRSVLLLMDNAWCRPPKLKDKYNNI